MALLGCTLLGCTTPPPPVIGTQDDPLSPPRSEGMPVIEVRTLEGRPRLAIVARDGDPHPALVLAMATDAGPIGNTALAAWMEARLLAAGLDAQGESDGIGVRLRVAVLEHGGMKALLETLRDALTRPLAADEKLTEVTRRLAALRRRPLDHPALEPVVACSAELAVAAKTPLPDLTKADGRATLERWRAGLVQQRSAMAVVGPRDAGRAALEALQQVGGWPSGTADAAPWPLESQHAAYLTSELAEGRSRVDVAVRVPSATRAVVGVKRMAGARSALVLKLAALEQPWRIESIHATAHPRGGCIRMRLRPRRALGVASLPKQAAALIPLVQREVALQAALPVRSFDVTREIIVAGDAGEAAARASWWALSNDVDAPNQTFSALAYSAHGRDQAPDSAQVLDTAYRQAVEQAPAEDMAAIAERVQRVEEGQGELWVLVGSPCALAAEGRWDAGRTALATLTVATAASDSAVAVQPWVSVDGVGIVAHASMQGAEDTPAALARRVARAAVQTFAAIPSTRRAFADAKAGLLGSLGDGRYQQIAQALLPAHPSWLDPWGSPEHQAAVTLVDAAERWRDLLHEPVRVAVLANTNEAQAEVAFAEVDRYLSPDARGRACELATPREASAAPVATGPAPAEASPDAPSRWLAGLPLTLDEDTRGYAELTAAWIGGDDGPLTRALGQPPTAHVLGGGRALAIVLETDSGSQATKERLTAALAALGKTPLAAEQVQRVVQRARARWRRRQAQPMERLSALFRGQPVSEPKLDGHAWSSWLSGAIRHRTWVVVGAR